MKNKKNTAFILALIIVLGTILRLYKVQSLPAILNRDEAAIGYNAFLLKETGKDEWGKTWPLTLKSFGDYKLPGYPLLVIGSFSIFGVNDFAVRFPSVLAGSLLVFLAYIFAKEMKLSEKYSLLLAFLVAITPVFVFYSRIAFEANVALAYFVGIMMFVLKKKTHYFSLALLLLLAVFTYNTPLLLLPGLCIFVILTKGAKKPKHWIGICALLVSLFLLGLVSLLSLSAQKSGITIFSDETTWMEFTKYRAQFSGIEQKILGNKNVYYGKIIALNYIKSFSSWFLVTRGGSHPWHSISGFGHILGIEYLFGLFGLLTYAARILKNVLKKKKFSSNQLALFFLIFYSLAPSVVTVDSPHATRSLFFFFLFIFLTVIGIQEIEKGIKKKKYKKIFFIFCIVAIFLQAGQYFRSYFLDFPLHQPQSLHAGYKNAIKEIENSAPHEPIAVVDPGGFQYIVTAWYLKTPPNEYRNSIIMQLPDKIGFNYGEQLTHYHFIVNVDDRNENELFVLEEIDGVWSSKKY